MGVLVGNSGQAERRRAWVELMSLCFTFSLLDFQIWDITNLPCDEEFALPFDPFDYLGPKDRFVIYIFRSFLLLPNAYRTYWAQQLNVTAWVSTSFPFSGRQLVKVRLVGYASEDFALRKLREPCPRRDAAADLRRERSTDGDGLERTESCGALCGQIWISRMGMG
jgi:hypothetical protein